MTYELTIEFEDGGEFQEQLAPLLEHPFVEAYDVAAVADDERAAIAQQPLRRNDDHYVPADSSEDADVREGDLYTVPVDRDGDVAEPTVEIELSYLAGVNDIVELSPGEEHEFRTSTKMATIRALDPKEGQS